MKASKEFKDGKLIADPRRKPMPNPGEDILGGYDKIYRVKKFDAKECAKLAGKVIVLDNAGVCYSLTEGKKDNNLTPYIQNIPEIPQNNSNIPAEYKKNLKETIHKIIVNCTPMSRNLPSHINIKGKKSVKHSIDNRELHPSDPSPNDIDQGEISDCYFLAALLAVLNTEGFGAEWIKNHMIDNGNNTVTVIFYDQNRKPYEITVEKSLRDDNGFISRIRGLESTVFKRAKGPLWVGILEKAFTIFACHNNYSILGRGGYPKTALAALTGAKLAAEDQENKIALKNVFETDPEDFNIFNILLTLPFQLEQLNNYESLKKAIEEIRGIKQKDDLLKPIKIIKVSNLEQDPVVDDQTISINLNSEVIKNSEISFLFCGKPIKCYFKNIPTEERQRLIELVQEKKEVSSEQPNFKEIIDIISTLYPEPKESLRKAIEHLSNNNLGKQLSKNLPKILKNFDEKELGIWRNMLETCPEAPSQFSILLKSHKNGRRIFLSDQFPKETIKDSYFFVKSEQYPLLYFTDYQGEITELKIPMNQKKELIKILENNWDQSIYTKDNDLSLSDLNKLREIIRSIHPSDKLHQVTRIHEAIDLFKQVITKPGKRELSVAEKQVLDKVIDALEKSNFFPGKRGSGKYTVKQFELYVQIDEALKTGKFVTFTSHDQISQKCDEKQTVTGETKAKGLVGHHAYAALSCQMVPSEKAEEGILLGCRIRNPWGNYGRVYDYEDNRYHAREDKSGEFWLELNDVCKRFNEVTIMNCPPISQAISEHIQSSSPAGLFGNSAAKLAIEAAAALEPPKI